MTETHNGHRCGTAIKPMTSDGDYDDGASGLSRGSHLNDLPTFFLYRFLNDLNASVPSKSSSEIEKDDGINKEIGVASTALKNMIHIATITTPSLALTSSSSVLSTPTKTREQIQSETAMFMSHPITRRTSPLKGKLNEQEQRQQQQTILLGEASRQMLDGCIDSMDQLVDARLRAYCNILQQHHSNRSTCNSHPNDDDPTSTGSQSSDQNANTTNTTTTTNNKNSVLDFKLRTLLELGTNISFESFQLSIQPASRSNSSSPFEAQTSSTTVKERMASTTSTTTTTTAVKLPIRVEIRMDGTSIGGLEPSHHHLATKKRKYRQPEEKEDQQDDDTPDSETASKDPSIIQITVPGIAIFKPRQSQEKHQEEEPLSSVTKTDRQKDEDADLAVDVVPNNIAYEHGDNTNDDSFLASRHRHSSPSVAVVSVSNKAVSSTHQYHNHRLQGDSELESNKGGDEHKEEHHQLLLRQNNDTAEAGTATQTSLSSEISSTGYSNSARNKTARQPSVCEVDISIQVDTKKLLSAMMEEAEKLVGFVVETTNTAWRNVQTLQHPDEKQEDDITNSDDNKDELTVNHDSSSSSLLSSASPKLGAKTVSEASFVPLNMSIEERKKEAEKDVESTNIGDHHRPVHLMAAPSAGLKGPSWPTDAAASSLSEPAVARSSSPFVASGSERSIHDEENHSPIDPAAAERASNIVDFIFGEIDFVENPTLPLLSTTAAPAASAESGINDRRDERSQSTRSKLPVSKSFRLSPMRKKLKRNDDHCVPSSSFLSSFLHGSSSPRNSATDSVATDAHLPHLKEKDAASTPLEPSEQSLKQHYTS